MANSQENIALACLSQLERENHVVEAFAFGKSSSWVALKNAIFEASLSHLQFAKTQKREFLSDRGLLIYFQSLIRYLRMAFRRQLQPIFFGAGSGLFEYQGATLDAYLPEAIETRPGSPRVGLHYFISATHLDNLARFNTYLCEHQVVIFSLLVAPLRVLFFCLLFPFLRWLSPALRVDAAKVSGLLAANGISVPATDILRMHVRFAAGYLAYLVLLMPIRMSQAYIVSAYSYSEIVAAVKHLGVKMVEIQHGLVGPVHRGYNYAVKSARLPTPDSVQVYNNFWRQELLLAGFYDEAAIVVCRRLKYALAEIEPSIPLEPYILFSGQGLLQAEINFIAEFVATDTRLHLVFVPHPIQTTKDLEALRAAAGEDNRVHVFAKKSCTTERLIIDSLAHVSIFSSCHFDALHYKGKTYVLDVLDQNIMQHYVRTHADAVILAGSAQDVLADVTS